jgi:hypothetical protein
MFIFSILDKILDKFTIKKDFIPLLQDLINYALTEKKSELKLLRKERTERIQELDKRIKVIKDKIIEYDLLGKNELVEIYEEELVKIRKERKVLELEDPTDWLEQYLSKVSDEAILIFTNPSKIIDSTNVSIKKDFVNTLFEWQLFYSKKEGIQTPSFPFIYKLFHWLNFENNHLVDLTGIEPVYRHKAV